MLLLRHAACYGLPIVETRRFVVASEAIVCQFDDGACSVRLDFQAGGRWSLDIRNRDSVLNIIARGRRRLGWGFCPEKLRTASIV